MSFQAYLDNIAARTGKGPDEFRALAREKGWLADDLLKSSVKAGRVIDWLRDDFGLGRGHAMAIVAVLKGDQRLG